MKKIILVSCLIIILGGCSLFDNKEPNDAPKNDDNKVNEVEDLKNKFSDDKKVIEEGSKTSQMFEKLKEYGKTLYVEKKYINYSKKDDIYFVSLKDLNELQYDVSLFVGDDGTVCNQMESGIYFDTEKKLNSQFEEDIPVVPILIGCNKSELEN